MKEECAVDAALATPRPAGACPVGAGPAPPDPTVVQANSWWYTLNVDLLLCFPGWP